jgi:8-oxo-dGTP pyrophosphatase MutT (NUDIX family)
MLVRDAGSLGTGVDVLMVRRPSDSRFAPGAYVFPGGRIEDADCAPELERGCAGLDRAQASRRMPDIHPPERALGAWVAAVRETFEESGILFACDAAGRFLSAPPGLGIRLASHRRDLHAERTSLQEILSREGLKLALAELHYFAHWITPEACPIRYDVRFFLAGAPADQTARHDGVETTDHRWVRPAEALKAYAQGDFPVVFPTRFMLDQLSRFANVEEAVRSARQREISPVLTRIVVRDGRYVEVMPDDDAT